MMDWVASKDMVSLAGLDNTDVAGKNAMIETAVLAEKVMNALGDSMPQDLRGKVGELRKDMELCKSVLRQHLRTAAPGGQRAHKQPCVLTFFESRSKFHQGF